jgi:hypothetical protein
VGAQREDTAYKTMVANISDLMPEMLLAFKSLLSLKLQNTWT